MPQGLDALIKVWIDKKKIVHKKLVNEALEKSNIEQDLYKSVWGNLRKDLIRIFN